jgi:glycosyltransferase involved in cell wall biosynthesis
LIDGLAFGAMPRQVEHESTRLRLIALVHHPLAAESGLAQPTAAILEASERRALAAARLAVVTSRATVAALEPFGIHADRIHVVEPGTDPAPLARGSRSAVVHLLSVATFIPRKGHETLFRALAAVPERNWRLTCVGSLERDRSTVARLRAILSEERLEDRVVLRGEMAGDLLAAQYDGADVFVLPTQYEGYGMVVAEALARGLPVISTPTGAIAELLGGAPGSRPPRNEPDAGLLLPPNDVSSWSMTLSRVVGDPWLRGRLAEGARSARLRLPSWAQASRRLSEVIASVQP